MDKCNNCGIQIEMYWCTKCNINNESDECQDCGIQIERDYAYHQGCPSIENKTYFCPKCNNTMDDLDDVLICSQDECGWNVKKEDKNTLDYHSRLDNCTPNCKDLRIPHTCNNKEETPY